MFTFTINGEIILQNTTTGKWSDIHIANQECLESLYGFARKKIKRSFKLIEILDYYYDWEKSCVDDYGMLNEFGEENREPVFELVEWISDLIVYQPETYAFIKDRIALSAKRSEKQQYQKREDIEEEIEEDINEEDINEDFDDDLAYEEDVLRSTGFY